MKKWKLLLVLFLLIYYSMNGLAAFWPLSDFEAKQQGNLRFIMGYSKLLGDQKNYCLAYNLQPGFDLTLDAYLAGQIYNQEHQLSYSINKLPGETLDGQIYWSNPLFGAIYDKQVDVDFSFINLAFKNNSLDGLKITSADDRMILFKGIESYSPMIIKIPILLPSSGEIRLFDFFSEPIPPSGGDILKNSEIISLNGTQLIRGEEYQLNYLNSELTMLIPVAMGDMIEAKFQFIPASEELAPPRESLEGVVVNESWLENNVSGFYFRRGGKQHQIAGVSGQWINEPLRIEGEWAFSKQESQPLAQAYYLDIQLLLDELVMKYLASDIGDNFHEMGVNQYTSGLSQDLEILYRLPGHNKFALVWQKDQVAQGFDDVEEVFFSEIVDLGLLEHHSCQIILEDSSKQINEISKEWRDVALGYTLEYGALKFELGQYLQNKDNRFGSIEVKTPGLDFYTGYQVENTFAGQEHQVNGVGFWQPIMGLDVNTLFEYRQPFDAEKGDYNLILNGSSHLLPGFSAGGQYVFFTDAQFGGITHRYTANMNYSGQSASVNLDLIRANMETETNKSYLQEINCGATGRLGSFNLGYALNLEETGEQDKVFGYIDDRSMSWTNKFTVDYGLCEYLLLQSSFNLTINQSKYQEWQAGEYVPIENRDQQGSYGLGFHYQKDDSRLLSSYINWSPDLFVPMLEMTHHYKYSWRNVSLDLRGGLSTVTDRSQLSPNHQAVQQANYQMELGFPDLFSIEPRLAYHYDFQDNSEGWRRKEDITLYLGYPYEKNRTIFLEAKGESVTDWQTPSSSYVGLGIFSGIEITF